MEINKTLYVSRREEWRAWLEQNHSTENEVWLIWYKTHTRLPSIPYDDAVEEALCFGWIDSILKRIDDDKYVRKFTPRKNIHKWSESNLKRVTKLLREGLMTEAGLAKIGDLSQDIADDRPKKSYEFIIPPAIEQSISTNPKAWENYKKLAPSYKKNAIRWITSAKKDETLIRRLNEFIDLLEQNKPLGLK